MIQIAQAELTDTSKLQIVIFSSYSIPNSYCSYIGTVLLLGLAPLSFIIIENSTCGIILIFILIVARALLITRSKILDSFNQSYYFYFRENKISFCAISVSTSGCRG